METILSHYSISLLLVIILPFGINFAKVMILIHLVSIREFGVQVGVLSDLVGQDPSFFTEAQLFVLLSEVINVNGIKP